MYKFTNLFYSFGTENIDIKQGFPYNELYTNMGDERKLSDQMEKKYGIKSKNHG